MSLSGPRNVAIYDASFNPVIATNTTPTGAEQGIIVRPLYPGSLPADHLDGQANIAQVATASVIASQGAGKKIVLQSLLATCSGSSIVQVIVSGGPNNRTFGWVSPGGGFAINAGGAALYVTSASSALSVAGDVTSSFNVFASGYVVAG